jgi:hypothetical protein
VIVGQERDPPRQAVAARTRQGLSDHPGGPRPPGVADGGVGVGRGGCWRRSLTR